MNSVLFKSLNRNNIFICSINFHKMKILLICVVILLIGFVNADDVLEEVDEVETEPELELEPDIRCPHYEQQSKVYHFAHETDCTKFYKCDSDGHAILMDCEEGLEFDFDIEVIINLFMFYNSLLYYNINNSL